MKTYNVTVRISARNARGYRPTSSKPSPFVWITVPVDAPDFDTARKQARKIARAQYAASR